MLRTITEQRGAAAVLPTARGGAEREGWLTLDLAAMATPSQAGELLDEQDLDAIFCIAGMTNVDGCEDAPELAQWTNARGPAALAAYAARRRVPFVYFSTEYVFDGSAETPGPYVEEAEPRPLNAYGRSKLAGERAVLAADADALVLRTTVVYGPDPREKNYLYSLMRSLAAGQPMRVPMDQISTPTYNADLVQATLGLVEAGAHGVFHVCGPEVMDRLTFARSVAETLRLDSSLLRGVATAELGQRAPRPLAAGLATGKLQTRYPGLRMRSVAEATEDCKADLKQARTIH